MRKALRPFLHQYDWEQCSLFEKKRFPVKEIALLQTGHLTFNQIAPLFRENSLDSYFKFCVFRDPVERFVSYYYFLHGRQEQNDGHLASMKRVFLDNSNAAEHNQPYPILFRPQSDFIVDENGQVKIDFIARYEQLQADFARILDTLQLPQQQLPQINITLNKKAILPDEELRGWIREFYHTDYKLLQSS